VAAANRIEKKKTALRSRTGEKAVHHGPPSSFFEVFENFGVMEGGSAGRPRLAQGLFQRLGRVPGERAAAKRLSDGVEQLALPLARLPFHQKRLHPCQQRL